MRAKIILRTTLGILIACALFAAISARFSRGAIEAASNDQRLRHERSAGELRQLERLLAVTTSDVENVTAVVQIAQKKSKISASRPTNERVLEAVRAFHDVMTNDPQAQLSHFATKRSEFTESYTTFFKQHNLAEETATQLVENEVRRYEQFVDLRFALEKMRPESLGPQEVAKLRQQIEDDLRASHVALLGDDGFRAFEIFQRTDKARQFVDRLAGNTAVLGVPISGQQADILIGAIANANPQFRSGTVATNEGVEWDKVFVIASDILSEDQLMALKTAAIPIWNKQRLEKLAAKSTASR